VSRLSYPKAGEPRPAALPPETRTVGQLVAETIQLYGRHFFASLLLGAPAAVIVALDSSLDGAARAAAVLAVGAPLSAAALVQAVLIAQPARPARGTLLAALAAGTVVFLPALVARLVVFPGIYLLALAWIAATVFAVPALLVEGLPFRRAWPRSLRLARADAVHALGGLATLTIAIVLTGLMLTFLLRGFSDQSLRLAAILALLVCTPLFFLGSALLYVDQAARVE
jgi:hypothetical protein